ncbi:zf-HC2 domain-containing protein [Kibdelosporangium philippinense]|uniref:Zf-HC2 domain-containing protein n=1 Tax=Kibdelosporangium philippinense TaxID=211113 RepID=A0ABS8ZQA2_9PSEU|nr:zf-HC2 domain-containing protein [Kibdelosporangium philippinense]MCE7008643.1 zf-HC2 domain-containing protein [Kibdelosporangium philippinense]
MDCGTCTEALSARLDGESLGWPEAEVDAHLKTCASCQDWYTAATNLNRRVKVRSFVPTPDLVSSVLAEAAPRRRPVARIALAGVGLIQLLLAMAQLFGTDTHAAHGATLTPHLISEGAAWNLALGLAMLAAAWQTKRAIGLLPAVGVFVAALVVFSVIDLATIGVPASRLLSHIPLVAGVALLYLVQREHKRGDNPAPTIRQDDKDPSQVNSKPEDDRRAGPTRPWLRPASHDRRAA